VSLASLCAIVFFAFLTEAVVGFGSTILTVTLAAHLMPLDELLPAFVPNSVLLSTALLAKGRGKIERRFLLRGVLPAVAVGMAAGLALFRLKSELWLQLAFGSFVVALALLDLARGAPAGFPASYPAALPAALPAGFPDPIPSGHADPGAQVSVGLPGPQAGALPAPVAAGLLAIGGMVHGLFGSGGPMIVYVAGRQIEDKRALRATLAVLWLVLNGVLLVNYGTLGLLDARSATRSAAMLPGLVLAVFLGDWVHGRLPPRPFKILVNVILLIAGGSLAIRTLRSILT
jgi:uncharacterized protein